MENCIFCRIIDGKIPCARVFESGKVMAFLDIAPISRGHTLVVPKRHSENLLADSTADLAECITAVQAIAKGIVSAVNADGFNLGVNTGKVAGQAVFHTHFHIIPRFEGDGLKHWPQGRYSDNTEMESVRKTIESRLK